LRDKIAGVTSVLNDLTVVVMVTWSSLIDPLIHSFIHIDYILVTLFMSSLKTLLQVHRGLD